jgi:hypothetical protein
VPFVPIRGTPLEMHPTPEPAFMATLLAEVAAAVRDGGVSQAAIKAGCGRCGACSTLRAYEGAA